MTDAKVRVLFVCLGNICRSPMAEGVFARVAGEEGLGEVVDIDSAGTGSWHIDEPPDGRAQEAAREIGADISNLRGRQVRAQDFDDFDFIVAMDENNLAKLRDAAPAARHGRIRLFLDFAPDAGRTDVPDPYYGGADGFRHVLGLIERASRGLARHIASGRHHSG